MWDACARVVHEINHPVIIHLTNLVPLKTNTSNPSLRKQVDEPAVGFSGYPLASVNTHDALLQQEFGPFVVAMHKQASYGFLLRQAFGQSPEKECLTGLSAVNHHDVMKWVQNTSTKCPY